MPRSKTPSGSKKRLSEAERRERNKLRMRRVRADERAQREAGERNARASSQLDGMTRDAPVILTEPALVDVESDQDGVWYGLDDLQGMYERGEKAPPLKLHRGNTFKLRLPIDGVDREVLVPTRDVLDVVKTPDDASLMDAVCRALVIPSPSRDEARERAERICSCDGHDQPDAGCPVHGTDDFTREVKTSVAAELIRRTGGVEPYMGTRQKRLDGSLVETKDVESEEEVVRRFRLRTRHFKATLTSVAIASLHEAQPDGRKLIVGKAMSVKKGVTVIPEGAYEVERDKLIEKALYGVKL